MAHRVVVEFESKDDADRFALDVATRGEVTVEYDQWTDFVVKFIDAKVVSST